MRIIRASEVNSYLFCQRAWMYRIQGIQPANQQELQSGNEMHYQHGRQVVAARLSGMLAWVLLVAAIVVAVSVWLR